MENEADFSGSTLNLHSMEFVFAFPSEKAGSDRIRLEPGSGSGGIVKSKNLTGTRHRQQQLLGHTIIGG